MCDQPTAERVGRLRFDEGMTAADGAEMVCVPRIREMRGGIAAQQREGVLLLQVVPVVFEHARLLEVSFLRKELHDLPVYAQAARSGR